jgi:uncharacterized membrane protein (UPF0127 family)
VVVDGHVFYVEVADTDAERARGLMGRTSLPRDAGMLFVWEGEAYRSFWMKDTLVPLDVLFISGAGTVVDIHHMEAQPGASDSELRRYPSSQPARYALEINYGLAEEYGFMVGMTAEIR